MDDDQEGMTLDQVNAWLATHRGHEIAMRRTRGASPLIAPYGLILTSLDCVVCGSGVLIWRDETDTGDPRQLKRLFR